VRVGFLVITFILALVFMRDLGFTPHRGKRLSQEISSLLHLSIDAGLRNPSVKWIMLAAPFSTGVMVYAFYAMQPYLLQLYGDEKAYGIAGLAAAIVAGAQIVGGLVAPWVSRRFKNRTSLLLVGTLTGAVVLLLIGFFANFWLAIGLFVLWALVFAAITPVRQAYLNSVIPSQQRATVLSFDSLLGSTGGVVIQPVLGKAADVWSYPASYILSAGFQAMALPFVWLAKRQEIAVKQITVQPSIVVPPTDKLV